MFRVALKSVLGNKLRLGMTALAIVLGVAFVTGTLVLTDSMDQAFGKLLVDANAGTDVVVNPVSPVETDITQSQPGTGPTLPEALLPEVQAVDGVEIAVGFVQGFAQVIDKDGEPVGGMGPPTFGFSWADESISSITLRQGTAPVGSSEVTLDAATVRDTGYELGDSIPILTANGVREYRLVGVTGFGEEDNLLGATAASFELATAQELLDKVGVFDQIAVAAASGIDPDSLRDAIAAAVESDSVEVLTTAEDIEQQQAEISEALGFLSVALLAFAGVALFVGVFLIINTFSIIVAQRTREFGLLRAVGASRGQISATVVVEAFVVGVFAGVIGFVFGIGVSELMRAVFSAAGLGFPDGGLVIETRTIIVPFALGIVVTTLASLLPARRASRISPMEALRDDGGGGGQSIGRSRTVGGAAILALGAVAMASGLMLEVSNAIAYVGLGAALVFVGVSLLAPYAAGPVSAFLGWFPARRGVAGRLARNNAGQNPKRTSSTASALMIGVALVTFISVFAASATASVNQLFTEQLGADFIIAPGGFGGGQVPTGLADRLRSEDEVGAVSPLRIGNFALDDGQIKGVAGVFVDDVEDLVSMGLVEGSIGALADGGILIGLDDAQALGLAVGDALDAVFPVAGEASVPVVGIFESTELLGSYVVSLPTFESLLGNGFDAMVMADVAEGSDAAATRTAIEATLEDFPNVEVQDQTELTQSLREGVDQLLNIMIGLLGLALVIALIGIVNTLALSVFERTREIGLLRAVGMTRRQVRSMIRYESIIVSIFGAVLGLLVGAFFGWAVVRAIGDDLQVLEFPVGRMVTYLIIAAIAGVVAAILPARRAARLDVLQAVTTE